MSSKTLEQYLAAAIECGQIDHLLRATRDASGKVTFYVHPYGASGETLDFVVRGNALVLNQTDSSDVTDGVNALLATRIPILEQITELCWAIEKCGASPELTDAVTKASALRNPITELVEQAISLGLDTGRMAATTSGGVNGVDPEPIAETGIGGAPGATTNPVHLAVDLSHAIARLAETTTGLRSGETSLLNPVNELIQALANKASGLLRTGQA